MMFFLWAIFAISVINKFHPWPVTLKHPEGSDGMIRLFYQVCISAPFREEIIFRLFPFMICNSMVSISELRLGMRISESNDLKEDSMIRLLGYGFVGSFLVFGMAHGSFYNVFIQGVTGVAFWFQFIYFSRIGKEIARGLAAAMLSHSLYNLICFLSLFIRL